MVWKIDDINTKLTEVADLAIAEGLQTISRPVENVIVLSQTEFDRLTTHSPSGSTTPAKRFVEHLLSAPKLTEDEIKLFERDKSLPRIVDFED